MKVTELKKVLGRVKKNGKRNTQVILYDKSFIVENEKKVYRYIDNEKLISEELHHSVSLKDINDVIKVLPKNSDVFFEMNDDNSIKLKCDKYTFTIEAKVNFDFKNYINYSNMNYRTHGMLSQEVIDLYQRCLKFTSKDEIAPLMENVCMRSKYIFASNRVGMIKESLPEEYNFEQDILLSQITIDKPCEMFENITLNNNEARVIKLVSDNEIHYTKIFGRPYPNINNTYRPEEYNKEIKVDKKELIECLRIASSIKSEVGLNILTLSSGCLNISAIQGRKSFSSDIKIENKESFRIGVNNSHLLDILNILPQDEIIIKFNNPTKALYINNAMLMPMKIKED